MATQMLYDEEEYPYQHEDLPSLKTLLRVLDWDAVCVFDACRWDAFEHVVGDAEPVRAPGSNTPTWTQEIWCDPDPAVDWSDVTYVSGNPVTTNVRNQDGYRGKIEDHVGEYVEAFQQHHAWGEYRTTSLPKKVANTARKFSPPVVVHFCQPHTPFIGDTALQIDGELDSLPVDNSLQNGSHRVNEYTLAEEGEIVQEFIHRAYLDNIDIVWTDSQKLLIDNDRVIVTADHGELLGPEKYDHGGEKYDVSRVVPFYLTWEPDLPPVEEVGGSTSHEWVYHEAMDRELSVEGDGSATDCSDRRAPSYDDGSASAALEPSKDVLTEVVVPDDPSLPPELAETVDLAREQLPEGGSIGPEDLRAASTQAVEEQWENLQNNLGDRRIANLTDVKADYAQLTEGIEDPVVAIDEIARFSVTEYVVALLADEKL